MCQFKNHFYAYCRTTPRHQFTETVCCPHLLFGGCHAITNGPMTTNPYIACPVCWPNIVIMHNPNSGPAMQQSQPQPVIQGLCLSGIQGAQGGQETQEGRGGQGIEEEEGTARNWKSAKIASCDWPWGYAGPEGEMRMVLYSLLCRCRQELWLIIPTKYLILFLAAYAIRLASGVAKLSIGIVLAIVAMILICFLGSPCRFSILYDKYWITDRR